MKYYGTKKKLHCEGVEFPGDAYPTTEILRKMSRNMRHIRNSKKPFYNYIKN